ncbi:MAG TPA: SpoIIE family protein phosphatase [Actinomycetes bacterium]|nr:SpoIIE family protein phosphatase [Actinomycetes bacterium]
MEERANLPPPGSAPFDEASGVTLSKVLGQLADGVVVVRASGRLCYANAAAIRLWGFAGPDQVPGTLRDFEHRFDLRDADGQPIPAERWPAGRALAGERFDDLECVFAGEDGTARRVRCAGGPVELEGGETGAWVSFRDVGREEAILRELREERDLVTALIDMSPMAVAVARAPEMVVELANDVAKALRPEVRMVGARVPEVFPEAGPAGFLELLRQVAQTGEAVSVVDAPMEWWRPGETRYFSMTYSRLPQPRGRPTRVLIMARETTAEVTARARAEAIAAERVRDLSRARVTSARLRSLVDLAAAIASVEDLDALLYLVTGEAARLLGSDMANLFLLDERGDQLIGQAHVGMDDEAVLGMRIVPAEWPEVGEVIRTGRPAVHTRADQVSGPERPYIERFGIRSYVAVRLGGPSRPLGVLFINYTGRRHRFSRPELAFVETLTSYLSVTIERARLVSVLREAVISLQAAVLPASFPTIPGLDAGALYRSASEVAQVGGDFYDLFALEDGRVGAVIGDVCGKGVAAARHTGRLRYELRSLLEDGRPPGRVLTAFNRRVQKEFAEDEYATLLLLMLDPATGAVRWSSAGHPPPVLSGPTPRTLAFAGSLPIGLFPDAAYRTARFTLPPGRCLVLYTDGVVEARNPDGQQFGTEGLEAASPAVSASAAAVAEVVLKQVLSHSGGHLDDDAAVLVLRREPVA